MSTGTFLKVFMDFITIILIAVGLAMDAFAVSIGIGTTRVATSPRSVFRISFHMGFFQGFMTFLGWLAGSTIASFIASIDHWVALVLLGFVGIGMIRSGLNPNVESHKKDPSHGGTLLMVCVATSIDAMAVGLSMAMIEMNILSASLVIGIITLGLSLVGLLAGKKLGDSFGKRMEIIGGFILNGIGLRIVLSHLFF